MFQNLQLLCIFKKSFPLSAISPFVYRCSTTRPSHQFQRRHQPNNAMERKTFSPPHEDYFFDHPEHHWPAWKFGLDMDDLFTTLPKQFNMMSCALLDRDAFFRDVSAISHTAKTREEFFSMLQERREMRAEELRDMWVTSFQNISGSPDLIGRELWPNAMFIYHFNSFDAIVRFFAHFVPERDETTEWAESVLYGKARNHDREPSAGQHEPPPTGDSDLPDPSITSTVSDRGQDEEDEELDCAQHYLGGSQFGPSITSTMSERGQDEENENPDHEQHYLEVSQSGPSRPSSRRASGRVQKSRQSAEGPRRSARLRERARTANKASDGLGKPSRLASAKAVRRSRRTRAA